jgi:tetratricopeptide (TPR) repeat protein
MAREHALMKSASSPPLPIGSPAPRRRPNGRSLAIILGIGVAFAALSLGVASLLNDPVGPRPVAAEVGEDTPTTPGQPSVGDLPPFSTLLDRPFPGDLATAQPQTAAEGLEARLAQERTPRRLVELAVAYQRLGTPERAVPLLKEALTLDPGFVPARVALPMAEAGSDPAGAGRAQARLEALERELPRNQLVVFNVAWAAVYAEDGAVAIRALRRTVALDDSSYLGLVAEQFLGAGGVSTSPTEP